MVRALPCHGRGYGFEPRRSRQPRRCLLAKPFGVRGCRVSLRPLGYGLTSRSPAERDEGGLRALGTSAANYLSRQSGTTADDPASHYGVFLRLYSPNRVETTRFTVTPKDFAPTRFERDQSGVATLRDAPLNLRMETPLSSRMARHNPVRLF